jgi:hypothetical protein
VNYGQCQSWKNTPENGMFCEVRSNHLELAGWGMTLHSIRKEQYSAVQYSTAQYNTGYTVQYSKYAAISLIFTVRLNQSKGRKMQLRSLTISARNYASLARIYQYIYSLHIWIYIYILMIESIIYMWCVTIMLCVSMWDRKLFTYTGIGYCWDILTASVYFYKW